MKTILLKYVGGLVVLVSNIESLELVKLLQPQVKRRKNMSFTSAEATLEISHRGIRKPDFDLG